MNKLALKSLLLAAGTCLSGTLLATPAFATTDYTTVDLNGNPFITLRVFNVGEGDYGHDGASALRSTWNLQPWQIDQIRAATNYWGQILQVQPGQNPAIINVGTFDAVSAAALSYSATATVGTPTKVQAALTDQPFDSLDYGAHGFIQVGTLNWATEPYVASPLALSGATSLGSVLIHEVAHALGVAASARVSRDPLSGEGIVTFSSLNAWSSHLRDENGKAASVGQYIWCNVCVAPEATAAGADADVFDAREDEAYFTGNNVSEVLNGAMKGLPVRVTTDYSYFDAPIFSHIELKNGLMGHQYYRNYTTLMEAELAALQDIGYRIDRRNFYGYSVYSDDITLINDHPYFARNSDGTAYIANSYNMATLGVGLHVYGSNNDISQRADLLTAGIGAAGIRIDGAGNDLTVLPGTKVHADGTNGRAIMFAYGIDHTLTQRGDVEALGDSGIAVSFDFGHNTRGDATGYRGSYIVENVPASLITRDPEYLAEVHAEVDGPLVTTFDLTGRIAGSKAAIFASENGYVGQINVMQGAAIQGDIISNYAEVDENGNLRLTDLTFGLKADGNGHALAAADPAFRISYGDDIIGKNIALQLYGGTSTFTGKHEVNEVIIEQGATLAGAGSYTIGADRAFNNDGILNPSIVDNDIAIDGNYVQSERGTLQLAFNNQKAISSLIVANHASLDGTISFAPIRGYYGNGFSLTSDKWLQAYNIEGDFAKVTTSLTSPTLTATATDNGDNSYTVSLSRADNAYAQFGGTRNGHGVGAALDQLANNPAPALQNLIAALDFSAADGSTIRAALPKLSPEAHASASGVLANASVATRSAISGRLQQAFGGTPASPVSVLAFGPDKQTPASAAAIDNVAPAAISHDDLARYAAWASVTGSWSTQAGDGNAARTRSTLGGFTSGMDALIYDNWRLGVMAGYSQSTFKTADRGSSGSSDNYTIGAYTGTEWGNLGFRSGLAYSWHTIEMSRSVAFNGYSDNLSSDYDGGTFQAFGELGYKIRASERAIFEPYANLAYVHVRTDAFSENGNQGAALAVQSNSTDLGLSTLGIRASTNFDLGTTVATARADLGWRHAFGDVVPTSTASFVAGSAAFTAAGNSIGKDTALIEAGLDFAIAKSTTLGLAYRGQFGSGLSQNGVNASLSVKF